MPTFRPLNLEDRVRTSKTFEQLWVFIKN
jgi:hypothetical protein